MSTPTQTRIAWLGCALLALAGCASEPEELACPECRPASDAIAANEGHAFLIRRVTFSEAVMAPTSTVSYVAAGLDLDGMDSGEGSLARGDTCEAIQEDYVSTADPVITGVDNAGQSLIRTAEMLTDEGSTFQGRFDEAMQEGRIRWAVRIGGLPAARPLRELTLEVYEIAPDETLAFDVDGFPASGQTLRARRVATATATVSGEVAFGLVDAPTGLEVLGDPDIFLLPFADFRLAGVSVSTFHDALTLNGQLGGSFSIDDLIARTNELAPEIESTLRSIFESVADLEPSAAEPSVCDRVSVGFGFDAVPVELVVE
jgi:hypothetical protein